MPNKKILYQTIRTTIFNQAICFGLILNGFIELDYSAITIFFLTYFIGMYFAYQRQNNQF